MAKFTTHNGMKISSYLFNHSSRYMTITISHEKLVNLLGNPIYCMDKESYHDAEWLMMLDGGVLIRIANHKNGINYSKQGLEVEQIMDWKIYAFNEKAVRQFLDDVMGKTPYFASWDKKDTISNEVYVRVGFGDVLVPLKEFDESRFANLYISNQEEPYSIDSYVVTYEKENGEECKIDGSPLKQ
jgi:hypothetical protein